MVLAVRHRVVLTIAALAIAVVAFATCHGDEPAPPHVDARPRGVPKPPAPHKSRRGAGAAGAATTTTVGRAGSGASERSDVPEDDGYPFVDVEVVNHDGTPASNAAIVYALRAGTTTRVEPPNVDVEDGRCRLHLLRAGRYDFGAVDGGFAALVADVDVPRESTLRITLPAPAEVTLLADPSLFPDDDSWSGAEFYVEASDENLAAFPGRGQRIRWSLEDRVEKDTRSISVVVATGAAGRVRFASHAVAAVPGTFTAPATLHVVRSHRFPLRLRIAFESPGASFPHVAALRAEFFVGDVAEPTATWTSRLAANESIGAAVEQPAELRADASVAEGAITWKGAGVLPGSQSFGGLIPDATNVVDLRLRLAADAPERDAAESQTPVQIKTSLRATGGDGADAPARVRLYVCDNLGDSCSSDAVPGAVVTFGMGAADWALASRGSWVADPVRLDTNPRTCEPAFELRRGGWLVVSLDRRPPPSLGAVKIRRKDGVPFLTEEGERAVLAASAEPGLVLGPFPEGGVDFVLELSNEAIGGVHADVRAGARDQLVIPSLAPR